MPHPVYMLTKCGYWNSVCIMQRHIQVLTLIGSDPVVAKLRVKLKKVLKVTVRQQWNLEKMKD